MKRIVISLVIVAVVALGLWGREKLKQSKESSAIATNVQAGGANMAATPMAGQDAKSAPNKSQVGSGLSSVGNLGQTSDLPSNPKASLNTMSMILMEAARGNKNFEGIVAKLKQTGQNPVITRDANTATGEMVIIRTQNPLPGTRYFHAQYFTDEENNRFVQHMSFEFKPGPSSMSDAVRAAAENFTLGEPTERKADFVQWNLDDSYVLWIKKKSAKDLQHDPFNAHDPKKDIGTVQMAVELRIHDDEDVGHNH